MSLFIAALAFRGGPLLDSAKIGILAGSFIAGLTGWLLLRTLPASTDDGAAPTIIPFPAGQVAYRRGLVS
jgi:NhaA family Na+:H+ antiporter